MLVELGVVEQRYQAVLEVLNDGATVTDVARRYGVARQTVHEWLRRYAPRGWAGWRIAARGRCRVRIRWRRRSRPGSWRCAGSIRGGGRARSCSGWSGRGGAVAGPHVGGSVSGASRAGHPAGRKRKRSDYKRWERSRAMELWQMDVVGGVRLVDGSEAKIVSGIDDHTRFVVSARVVARATAVRCATRWPWRCAPMGCPRQILTDNGKVFTARFGPGPGRCCSIGSAGRTGSAPPDRAAVADHDGQGRAVAQDPAPRVPRRQGVRLDRRRPSAARRLGAALQPRAPPPVDRSRCRPWNGSGSPAPPRRQRCRSTPMAEPAGRRRPAGQRQGHDQLRHRHLQGRGVAGRPDRRGRLRGRAGATPPPWCAHRHPRPPSPRRQAEPPALERKPPAAPSRPSAVGRRR